MARRRTIRIAQMGMHFLYLPLYYAEHKDWFGYVPSGYDIEIIHAERESDESTYEMLMDRSLESRKDVDFAICDPVVAYKKPVSGDASAAVVGELITNTAFWAVNHKKYTINSISDLARFAQIIAFPQGTTSYGIASRIAKETSGRLEIKTVAPGEELTTLTQAGDDAVALSPDVLGIVHLSATRPGFGFDFQFSGSPEYNSMFVTALITRKDVVERDRQLVLGLLQALQSATELVRLGSDEVVTYAARRFSREPDRVRQALHRANDEHLYPWSIEVSRAHWINAVKAYHEASGEAFSEGATQQAGNIFAYHIEAYGGLSEEVVRRRISFPLKTRSEAKGQSVLLMGLGLTVLLVISIIGGWWKPLVTFVLPAGVAAAGSFIGQATSAYFELARMPKLRLLHWCFWGGLTVMGAGWVSGTVGGPKQFVDVVNGAIYVWAMAALLTGDLGVIVNAATREQ